jgi:hypothetical protein
LTFPIATEDNAAQLWNASDLTYHPFPAGLFVVCDIRSPTSALLTTNTLAVSPTRAHASLGRQPYKSTAESSLLVFTMPMCGGTKSVQRKLVLLYVLQLKDRAFARTDTAIERGLTGV